MGECPICGDHKLEGGGQKMFICPHCGESIDGTTDRYYSHDFKAVKCPNCGKCSKADNFDAPGERPTYAELITEREETISYLRKMCATYGSANWNSGMKIYEIINEHLLKHLLKS
jgi:NAD-dependent SIR2 family protein deacetylase